MSNFCMIFLSGVAIGAIFYFLEYVLKVTGIGLAVPIVVIISGIFAGAVLLMQWVKTVGSRAAMLRGMSTAGLGLVNFNFHAWKFDLHSAIVCRSWADNALLLFKRASWGSGKQKRVKNRQSAGRYVLWRERPYYQTCPKCRSRFYCIHVGILSLR